MVRQSQQREWLQLAPLCPRANTHTLQSDHWHGLHCGLKYLWLQFTCLSNSLLRPISAISNYDNQEYQHCCTGVYVIHIGIKVQHKRLKCKISMTSFFLVTSVHTRTDWFHMLGKDKTQTLQTETKSRTMHPSATLANTICATARSLCSMYSPHSNVICTILAKTKYPYEKRS